jgi:signal peptidase II
VQLNKKLIITSLLIALISLVIDQASKIYLVDVYKIASIGTQKITDFFNLVMVWNRGISFGMFSGHESSNYFFIGVSIVIVGVLAYWLTKTDLKLEAIGIGFVLGGAIGNIIDRFRYGAVADFFDFHIGDKHWPAFNIADSSIFIGACILIISSLFFGKKN